MLTPNDLLDLNPSKIAFISQNQEIQFANQGFAACVGMAAHSVVNQPLSKVLPVLFPRLSAKLESAFSGVRQDFVIEHFHHEGEELKCDRVKMIPRYDSSNHVCGVLVVMDDDKNIEQVDSINSIFRHAVDQAMEGFALHDNEGNFTYINPAQAEMYGYTQDEVVGNGWQLFYDDQQAQIISEKHFPDLLQNGRWNGVLKGRKKDGSLFDVEVTLTLLVNEHGQPKGLVCNCKDVTERLKKEEVVRQLQRMESLGQLTSGVAHDFNNLLAVILGNLELVKSAGPNPQINEAISQAQSAAKSGAELIGHLLAFARKQHLAPVQIQTRELISDMQNMLSRTLGEQIDVQVTIHPELWPCSADKSQLENAILNLALNARDAMPNGGTIEISARNYADGSTLDCEDLKGEFVGISVKDNGTGMSAKVIDKMFDPFFTTKNRGQGSGLGLSMVHGFVGQSGGGVSARSEVGKGTEVTIFIPRGEEKADSVSTKQIESTPLGSGERILVVEDQPTVRTVISNLLTSIGYEVVSANNGDEALSIVKENEPIDLVLSDVEMPGKWKGNDLVKQIQRERPDLVVVLMTGFSGNDHVEQVPVLNKPFTLDQLAKSIQSNLRQTSPC